MNKRQASQVQIGEKVVYTSGGTQHRVLDIAKDHIPGSTPKGRYPLFLLEWEGDREWVTYLLLQPL